MSQIDKQTQLLWNLQEYYNHKYSCVYLYKSRIFKTEEEIEEFDENYKFSEVKEVIIRIADHTCNWSNYNNYNHTADYWVSIAVGEGIKNPDGNTMVLDADLITYEEAIKKIDNYIINLN